MSRAANNLSIIVSRLAGDAARHIGVPGTWYPSAADAFAFVPRGVSAADPSRRVGPPTSASSNTTRNERTRTERTSSPRVGPFAVTVAFASRPTVAFASRPTVAFASRPAPLIITSHDAYTGAWSLVDTPWHAPYATTRDLGGFAAPTSPPGSDFNSTRSHHEGTRLRLYRGADDETAVGAAVATVVVVVFFFASGFAARSILNVGGKSNAPSSKPCRTRPRRRSRSS